MCFRFVWWFAFSYAVSGLAAPSQSLIVYTYDSLAGKKSFGGRVKALYEKKYPGRKVELVSFPSAGEAVSQLILEGTASKADVIMGVDASMLSKLRTKDLMDKVPKELTRVLREDLKGEGEELFVPFDYGYVALIYDSRRTKVVRPTVSLMDLARLPEFRKKIVVQDPTTSSLGSSFLYFTRLVLSESDWKQFWVAMDKQLFRLVPSWSSGYGLFSDKQVDFVLSYTTSPAYHQVNENTDAFRSLFFTEGQFLQWEGIGVIKKSRAVSPAWDFVSVVLSQEAQNDIALTNWMFPARTGVKWPKAFEKIPVPHKVVSVGKVSEAQRTQWLKEWTGTMGGRVQ